MAVAQELGSLDVSSEGLSRLKHQMHHEWEWERIGTGEHQDAVRLLQCVYVSVLTMLGGIGTPGIRRVSIAYPEMTIQWASNTTHAFAWGIWDEDAQAMVTHVSQTVLGYRHTLGDMGGLLARPQSTLRYYAGALDTLQQLYRGMIDHSTLGRLNPEMDRVLLGVLMTHLPLDELNALLARAAHVLHDPLLSPGANIESAIVKVAILFDMAVDPERSDVSDFIGDVVIPRLADTLLNPRIRTPLLASMSTESEHYLQGLAQFYHTMIALIDRVQ